MDTKKEVNKNRKQPLENTWFWKYVVDNKFVSMLFIIFLLFLTIFLFTKIAYVFEPIGQALSIIGPPAVFAMLFYYLLKPMVDQLEERGMSRKLSIWTVFAGIILLIALATTFIIPGIRTQVNGLIENFPNIWDSVLGQVEELLYTDWLTQIYQEVQATNILERISEQITSVFSGTIGGLGSFFGGVAKVTITIFTMPFVLYYFLVDREWFKNGIIQLTPTRARPVITKFMEQASEQVGSYVRGELLVAISVAIIFYVGYRIIDLEYALLLSILAGILNLVPYLGSIMASVPALIIGAFVSPWKLVQVMIVLAVEQTIEGRVVSPQILGNKLDIHPLVILFILLVAGSLFGFMGLILAVPGFGVIRVIWNLFFEWIRETYDYYEEVEIEAKSEE